MDLSETIKRIRADKGITQAEIARRLNLERGNYSRLESRGKKLTLEQLESIAQALDVTLLDILNWGEPKPRPQSEVDMIHEIETLRERIKELEEIIDIQSEGSKMRRLAAKQLLDQYQDLLPVEKWSTRQNLMVSRTLTYLAILADKAENDSSES